MCEGVVVAGESESVVVIGVKPNLDGFCSCALLNVFLTVGLVADNVSNRKLVAFFPKAVGATLEVSSESLGRFEGEGEVAGKSCWSYVVTGDEGRTATDMVCRV